MVRQALNFAMNRPRMVDSVRKGVGQAQDLPWASSSPASDPSKNALYGFDLARAKATLDQSGASNVTFDLVYSAGGDAQNFAQIYQADLATIGITANLKPGEGTAARQAMATRTSGSAPQYSPKPILPSKRSCTPASMMNCWRHRFRL